MTSHEHNLQQWHSNLKSPSSSYSAVSLLSLISLTLCFLLSGYLKNDQSSYCLFIMNVIFTLYALIFYYPIHNLTFPGCVHIRICKWIFFLMSTSALLVFVRLYTELTTTAFFSILFGIRLFQSATKNYPKTFTLTELILLINFIIFGHFIFFAHLLRLLKVSLVETLVIEQAIGWLLILIILLTKLKIARNNLFVFVFLCLINLFGAFMPLCSSLINQNPFEWLFSYIFNDSKKIYLLAFWFFLFTCTSLVLLFQWILVKSNISSSKSLTVTRKLFHVLICCVYLPGLLIDRHFLYLCSYGMLILLCLLETIRYFKVSYIADKIDYLMKLFVDEKDREGSLILSHIYLLIGLSVPIWISTNNTLHVSDFSGLLTIGIGDTFASIVGSQFGKHKWPGTHRSIEGSLSFIISQLIAYYLFYLYGIFDIFYNFNILFISVSLVVSAFIEAFTSDNDNLLLSIITYPFLILI